MSYPTKKLGEICDFQGGSQPPKSEFIFEPKAGYIRFLQIRDFSSDKNITYIPNSTKNRICENDDILIGRYGASVGKILTGKKGAYNVAIIKTFPNFNFLDKGYFYFYLISNNFQSPLLNACSRAAQDGFSKKDIENFSVLLPPLPTQKLIVQKLDSSFEKIDKSIELTKKNLENIEELNKSVLEEVFRKSDFKEKSIDEISNVKSGKRLPKGNKVSDKKTEFPYIRVSDFNDNGTIDLSNLKYITEDVFNQISRYIITEDDLYISIAGTIGKTGIIPSELNGASLTENAVRLVYKNKNDIFNKYVYYFTTSIYFKEQAGLATRAVAMPKLAIIRLKEIQIPLPPLQKQKEIVAQLDKVFEKNKALKESYEKKLKDLEEMKQSLLKEAFEGRLVENM